MSTASNPYITGIPVNKLVNVQPRHIRSTYFNHGGYIDESCVFRDSINNKQYLVHDDIFGTTECGLNGLCTYAKQIEEMTTALSSCTLQELVHLIEVKHYPVRRCSCDCSNRSINDSFMSIARTNKDQDVILYFERIQILVAVCRVHISTAEQFNTKQLKWTYNIVRRFNIECQNNTCITPSDCMTHGIENVSIYLNSLGSIKKCNDAVVDAAKGMNDYITVALCPWTYQIPSCSSSNIRIFNPVWLMSEDISVSTDMSHNSENNDRSYVKERTFVHQFLSSYMNQKKTQPRELHLIKNKAMVLLKILRKNKRREKEVRLLML